MDYHQVSAYLFIDGFEEDFNTFVDVTDYKEQVISASMNPSGYKSRFAYKIIRSK